MHNTLIDLRGKSGREMYRKDYMAVSPMKRAAEGDIYDVTFF
jgi:hypothetical protein